MSVERKGRRQLQGVVTSTKPDQTITVVVERTHKHRRYGKYVRSKKKYMVHDEQETAQDGDVVEIAATRRLSKQKRWRLVKILRRGDLTEVVAEPEPSEVVEEVRS